LNQIAAQLTAVAADYQIAVVLTNQMTTKVDSVMTPIDAPSVRFVSSMDISFIQLSLTPIQNSFVSSLWSQSGGSLIPALGESWAHNCTQRVLLQWSSTYFSFHLKISQSHKIKIFHSLSKKIIYLSLFPVCAQRVVLSEDELCVVCSGESRVARLLKSPSQQYRVARYHITPDGIR